MSAIQSRQLQQLTNRLLAITLLGLSIVQACGRVFPNEKSEAGQSERELSEFRPASATTSTLNEKMVEGTWTQACKSGTKSTEEKLILLDGKFTREFISYMKNCQDKVEHYSYSGTYSLGTKASNIQELSYENGNFNLKPTSLQNIHEINFTIDEWTMKRIEKISAAERAEIDALSAECTSLDVEITDTLLRVRRNGCVLSQFTTHLFDIIAVEGTQLRLGVYIDNLNTFDPAGGTSPVFRSNVISNLYLKRNN